MADGHTAGAHGAYPAQKTRARTFDNCLASVQGREPARFTPAAYQHIADPVRPAFAARAARSDFWSTFAIGSLFWMAVTAWVLS